MISTLIIKKHYYFNGVKNPKGAQDKNDHPMIPGIEKKN